MSKWSQRYGYLCSNNDIGGDGNGGGSSGGGSSGDGSGGSYGYINDVRNVVW